MVPGGMRPIGHHADTNASHSRGQRTTGHYDRASHVDAHALAGSGNGDANQPTGARFVTACATPYIDQANGQIERLETDGVTRRAITDEATRITDFDISPVDGSLIYVTDNQLVQTDVAGSNRVVKVSGEPFDPQSPEGLVNLQISAPRFSPDGKQIAFGLGGVNLIATGIYHRLHHGGSQFTLP